MGELTRRQRLLPCENATLWHKNSANFQPGSVGIMASYYQVQGWLNFILSSNCVNYGTEISTYRTSSAHEISPFVTKVTVSYKKWPETRVSFMCEVTSKLPVQISPFLYYDYPFVEGLTVINDPKCNKVLNVITFSPKSNKILSCKLQ